MAGIADATVTRVVNDWPYLPAGEILAIGFMILASRHPAIRTMGACHYRVRIVVGVITARYPVYYLAELRALNSC
jgi:hypothetical protein